MRSRASFATCLAATLAALAFASAPGAAQAKPSPKQKPGDAPPAAPSDRDLERAWKRLSAEEKVEVCEWFAQETKWLEGFQAQLVRFVLERQERDAGTWPAAEPPPFFDPAVHAAADVIERKELAPTSPLLKQKRERFFAKVPRPRLSSAWEYDYGTRELRRTPKLDDPERIFANALHGFAPGLDLAQALVEQALDDGSQQALLGAFAHAYTDREGRVFSGMTLYDAWSSGSEIEMPDVDCLGIVHTVFDDWSTWVAPVPATRQDALYDRIGELFQDARRHRGLRQALAQCFLVADPELRDGYAASLVELHALWESAASTPTELVGRLPAPSAWKSFLQDWTARCKKEPDLRGVGDRRRAALASGAQEVRATFARVLTEFAARDE
jgi:hypothetical protein